MRTTALQIPNSFRAFAFSTFGLISSRISSFAKSLSRLASENRRRKLALYLKIEFAFRQLSEKTRDREAAITFAPIDGDQEIARKFRFPTLTEYGRVFLQRIQDEICPFRDPSLRQGNDVIAERWVSFEKPRIFGRGSV